MRQRTDARNELPEIIDLIEPLTLCRFMNIPARYVTGISAISAFPKMPGRWISVLGLKCWRTLVLLRCSPQLAAHWRIVMARGRDAGDVPITMCFGQNSLLRFEVITEEIVSANQIAVA